MNKFKLTDYKDKDVLGLMEKASHRTLAVWAIDCTERVMPYFEDQYPNDKRPRVAIDVLREWIATGTFSMSVIRYASLSSHAAAREVGQDDSSRSAARAAGQAVATAHVRTHSLGAAIYALQAVYRASIPINAKQVVATERDWQLDHLIDLIKLYKDK